MYKFVFLIRIISSCFIIGFASAQKVIQLSYCSIDEDHLRMDCKYSLPSESSEVFCKYTHGERLFDTTDPSEEQHAPFKKRAKARIFPGNICRLLYKNLPNGKSTFTCNIKVGDSAPVTKTSVVEKSKMLILMLVWPICALPVIFTNKNRTCELDKQNARPCEPVLLFLITELLLPCSAWSVLLQSCSGLLLTLMTFPMLLEIHWLWRRRQTAAYLNTATITIWSLMLYSPEVACMHKVQ